MKRYELLQNIIIKKDARIADIENEYRNEIKSFDYSFSQNELENNGWVKIGFYCAGNEHVYEKNGKKIAVTTDYQNISVRTSTGIYPIYDYEHLVDYSNGLVYSDLIFYAYY